jgi:addiction module HigA family antidote
MGMYNPPHPGETIKEDILPALSLTITDAANALGISRKTLSAICNGRQGITPEVALKLAAAFGGTAGVWLRQQAAYDVWQAEQIIDTSSIRRFSMA